MRKLLFPFGFSVFGLVALLAQNGLKNDSGTVPVQMIVTAEARQGKDVPALNQGDVGVYEQKNRLKVDDLIPLQNGNAALDLFLLLDDASATSLGSQLSDLRKFIQGQPATAQIGIGYMRNGTFDMTQNFTADHNSAGAKLRLPIGASALASPYLSLSDLIKRWPGHSARREVIMVSSGIDPLGGTGSIDPYLDSAIADAQRAGVIVYTIFSPATGHSGHDFFRLNWGQNYLAQLSEETGGESYMLGFSAPVAFGPYLDEIAEHLQHQYRLTFRTKPEKKGEWRSVRLSTEVPNADLVAATKVYVPAVQ